MSKIISSPNENSKQIEDWADLDTGDVRQLVKEHGELRDLLRRAAELIRDAWQSCLAPGNEPENAGYYGSARTAALKMRNEWLRQRDQWLKDAGMEQ